MRNSWIWKEAERLARHTEGKREVIFECGYGPSGLPHIGTFAEVARTSMVQRAFETITGRPSRIIVFSDDMDALRKVPDNVPNRSMLERYIGRPISQVPNPFDTAHESFADHNNHRLIEFLDRYGFCYEFVSSSTCYKNGTFNPILVNLARRLEDIKRIITHDYSPERRETYCPFLPIHDGVVWNEVRDWNVKPDGLPEPFLYWFRNARSPESSYDDRQDVVTPITNGNVKCQWKLDWAMRWIHFGVDYEMHGKDLLGSAQVGQRICQALGERAPLNFMYELFLDENGEKISKSRGNGFEFSEWVRYAPAESLQWFLYQNPRKSRKLHWAVVPQATDSLVKESHQEPNQNDAYWAIYGADRQTLSPISFTMLINLVSITDVTDSSELLRFVQNYNPEATLEAYPFLESMLRGALNYYTDHILPSKVYKTPNIQEKAALIALANAIEGLETADDIMYQAYEVGKLSYGEGPELKNFFQMIYQVLMGQDSGPRFGQFAEITGTEILVDRIREICNK